MAINSELSYDKKLDILKKTIILDELIDIDKYNKDERTKAFKLRKKCTSYNTFMRIFFSRDKVRAEYKDYEESIMKLKELFIKYEENGLFDESRKESAFILKDLGNLDARYLVMAYINDSCSYDSNEFFKKYKTNLPTFRRCVLKVKKHAPELYKEYLYVEGINKERRLAVPIYNINSIIEGIQTGKTYDGNDFDIFEFYKLTPFKNNIDRDLRSLEKDFTKLNVLRAYKTIYCKWNNKHSLNYAENLYLFTKCFNENGAEVLKQWMDDNGIKNITPIHRASTINYYYGTPEDAAYTMSDAEEIFDTMEEKNYPKIKEIYDILKDRKIKKKKALSMK